MTTANIFIPLAVADEIETFYDLTANLAHDLARNRFIADSFDDSRSRLHLLVEWANEFNSQHVQTDWAELDYMDTVDDFYADKVQPFLKATASQSDGPSPPPPKVSS